MGSRAADIRELLRWFEDNGWKVEPAVGSGYPKVLCPCGKHQRRIHKTPSGPNYLKDTRKWAERQTCWSKTGGPS